MEVAKGKRRESLVGMEGDRVVDSSVSNGSIVSSNLGVSNTVSYITTEKESVRADNGVGREDGALEKIKVKARVDKVLLVVKVDLCILFAVKWSIRISCVPQKQEWFVWSCE